jgi:hypothetical protein
MSKQATVRIPATVRIDVEVTVALTDEAIADIKANRDGPARLTITDAKLGPHAGITVSDLRTTMQRIDHEALDVAVVNAVRNGQLG